MFDAYMLRLWRSHPCDSWRATLINIDADATEQHFSSIADLLAYLGRTYPPPPGSTHRALLSIPEKADSPV